MRRNPALVFGTACLALVGCGNQAPAEGPRVGTSPATSHRSSPSLDATTVPTPPAMPKVAREHTPAGAKAFVHYLVSQLDYAQASLDSSSLRPLMSKACSGCNGALSFVNDLASKRGHNEGGLISANHLRVMLLTAGNHQLARVRFDYHNTRQVIRFPTGRTVTYLASTAHDIWTLSSRADTWQLIDWQVG